MAQFPNTPSFTGFNTPSRIEADIADLAHEGTIPEGLNGAFYRVQPDAQFPPRLGDDIAFNGAVTPKLAPTAKITSPSKKVIAVTVANAKGKTLVISVVGVRKATFVVPVAASKTYKISVPSSGSYRVSVTVGATSVVKRITTK